MIIGIDASRAAISKRTGTEAYAYHLITHLIPLAISNDHQLRFYFNSPPPPNLFPYPGLIDYRVIPFRRMWTHLRLGAELAFNPPDLFFTPAHVIPYTWFGKSIATIHDLGYEHFPEAHTADQVRYLRWSTKHNAKRSRIILADSLATKDDLIELYQTPVNKIEVVYPGIDPLLLDEAQSRPPLQKDQPYLLFLSTIQPRKNVGRIIDAFALIADQIPHKLILAGQLGWRSEPILAQIRGLPESIQDRIDLPGYIPDQEKAALIKGATAFIYPSLNEGFGFPLLEANACGVPVVTANSSSLAELAETGAALTVDPLSTAAIADGIIQLINDNQLREQLIDAGFKNIERFSWQKGAERVMTLIESLDE